MRVVPDACSLINLHKGGVLDVVLGLEGVSLRLPEGVLKECVELGEELQDHIGSGRIGEIPDTDLSVERVAQFANENNLGVGESECIARCQDDPSLVFCTDDRRARHVARQHVGDARVIGTEDLLLECVRQGMSPLDAYTAHETMRARGAFLPERPREFFILDPR